MRTHSRSHSWLTRLPPSVGNRRWRGGAAAVSALVVTPLAAFAMSAVTWSATPLADPEDGEGPGLERIAYLGTAHRSVGVVSGQGADAVSEPFFDDRPGHFDDEISASGDVVTWVSRRDAPQPEIYVRRGDGPAIRVTTTGEAEGHPVLTPDAARIAFHAPRLGGGHDVFVVDAAGGAPRRATDGTGDNTWPTWSPDGRSLAFQRAEENQAPQVYRIPSGGGQAVRLTNDPAGAGEPAWDPDPENDRIVYTRAPAGGPDRTIRLMDPAGGQNRNVLGSGWDGHQGSWSPDGSTLAFLSTTRPDGSSSGDVDLVYTGAPRDDWCPCETALRLDEDRLVTSPTWYTPPGGGQPGGEPLLLVARTTAPDRGTATLQDVRPDGVDPRDLGLTVLREDPDAGTNPERLWNPDPARGDPWTARPAYSPDGLRIAVTRFETVGDQRVARTWIVEADGGGARLQPLAGRVPGGVEAGPAWSPDGTKLAIALTEPGRASRIVVFDAETGRRIVTVPGPALVGDAQPAWSADGATIAFTRGDAESAGASGHVWLADAETGGRARDLTAEVCGGCAVVDHAPAFSPDGTRIALSRRDDGVILVNLDGSQCQPALPPGATSCSERVRAGRDGPHRPREVAWSPDGTRLVFSSRRGPEPASPEYVKVLDLNSGESLGLTYELPGRQKVPTWRGTRVKPPPGSPAVARLTALASPAPGYVGGRVTVTYTVINAGGSAALGLRLRPAPPAGVPVTVVPPGCDAAGCDVPDLPPGGSAALRFEFAPTAPVATTVAGTLTSSNAGGPSATAPFVVLLPRIMAVPPVGPPGFVTSIRGTDFPPGTPVRLAWSVGVTVAANPAVPGPDGRFTAQLQVLPRDQIGPRLVTATGQGFSPVTTGFRVVTPAQQPPGMFLRR